MIEIAIIANSFDAVVWKFIEYVAIFLGIITSIFTIERHLFSPKWRAWLTKLIKRDASSAPWERGDPPRTIAEVLLSSTEFFDHLFSQYHWTKRCMLASAAFTITASIFSLVLVMIIGDFIYLYRLLIIILTEENMIFIMIALVLNLTLNYLSLWETREVIAVIRRDQTCFTAFMLLLADIIFTYALFILFTALLRHF